jgi:hypothetical protein
MAVQQLELFGVDREVINGVVIKITTIENTAPTAQGLGARQTEVCRECVRSEQSDGMYGNHCGKCDCCK